MKRPLVLLLLLAGCAAPAPPDPEWSAWRGPSMDGTHPEVGLFEPGFTLELAWSRELGPGYSSVTVASGVAVTMFSDGDSDLLVALDAESGEELWRRPFGETRRGEGGAADGPLGSPTIHDGVVYALGPRGHLFAARLDDGADLWTRRIDQEPWQHGFAGTPLVADGQLVVQTAAYEAQSGRPLWSHGNEPVHYQSPVRFFLQDREHLLLTTSKHVYGLTAEGAELWRHPHIREVSDGHTQLVPVGTDGLLIHYLNGSLLYDVSPGGLVERWRSADLRSSLCPPLHHEGYLYGFSGENLVCIDSSNGEIRWTAEDLATRGVILVDGHLLILTVEGALLVAPASPEGFGERKKIATPLTDSYTWPSYAAGRVFMRDLKQVVAVRIVPASR